MMFLAGFSLGVLAVLGPLAVWLYTAPTVEAGYGINDHLYDEDGNYIGESESS